MVSGCWARLMDTVNLSTKVAPFTRDRGLLISNTEMGLRFGQMAAATKEITCKASRMDSDSTDGQMARNTLATGWTTRSMGSAITSGPMVGNT